MPKRKGNIPDSVWLDPKTGREPKTREEFAAQNKRVADWLVKRAAEEAAKKFEEGQK
jgi:hypothetical protein